MAHEPDGRAGTLRRIAAALNTSVEALISDGGDRPSAEELDDLIRSFTRITDPVLRRRCLAQVRAAASACIERLGPETH